MPADQTTSLRVAATDAAGNASACSAAFTYTEDSSTPAAPSLDRHRPRLARQRQQPRGQGLGRGGLDGPDLLDRRPAPAPRSRPAAPPSSRGAGITTPVAGDQTTSLRATATDAVGNPSACSSALRLHRGLDRAGHPVDHRHRPRLALRGQRPRGQGIGRGGLDGEDLLDPRLLRDRARKRDGGPILLARPHHHRRQQPGDRPPRHRDRPGRQRLSLLVCVHLRRGLDRARHPLDHRHRPRLPLRATTTPRSRASADAGSTVRIYSTATCTGSPLATGSAASFGGAGITTPVPENQTTNLRATATDAVGNASACSSALAYVEDSSAPRDRGRLRPRRPHHRRHPDLRLLRHRRRQRLRMPLRLRLVRPLLGPGLAHPVGGARRRRPQLRGPGPRPGRQHRPDPRQPVVHGRHRRPPDPGRLRPRRPRHRRHPDLRLLRHRRRQRLRMPLRLRLVRPLLGPGLATPRRRRSATAPTASRSGPATRPATPTRPPPAGRSRSTPSPPRPRSTPAPPAPPPTPPRPSASPPPAAPAASNAASTPPRSAPARTRAPTPRRRRSATAPTASRSGPATRPATPTRPPPAGRSRSTRRRPTAPQLDRHRPQLARQRQQPRGQGLGRGGLDGPDLLRPRPAPAPRSRPAAPPSSRGAGLTTTVAGDQTTSFRATATDAVGNPSACSSALHLQRGLDRAGHPVDHRHRPRLALRRQRPRGSRVSAESRARAVQDAASTPDCLRHRCSQAATAAQFSSPGAHHHRRQQPGRATSAPPRPTRPATPQPARRRSPTSRTRPAPATPSITDTDPDSPAERQRPRGQGLAPRRARPSGSTRPATCTGSPLATGSAASLRRRRDQRPRSPENQTTSLRATATDAVGNTSRLLVRPSPTSRTRPRPRPRSTPAPPAPPPTPPRPSASPPPAAPAASNAASTPTSFGPCSDPGLAHPAGGARRRRPQLRGPGPRPGRQHRPDPRQPVVHGRHRRPPRPRSTPTPPAPPTTTTPSFGGTANGGRHGRASTSAASTAPPPVGATAPRPALSRPRAQRRVGDDATPASGPTATDAGNTSPDPPPALRPTLDDSTAPQTHVDSGPSGPTTDATPTFGFSATGGASGFECRFDSASFGPCSDPGLPHPAGGARRRRPQLRGPGPRPGRQHRPDPRQPVVHGRHDGARGTQLTDTDPNSPANDNNPEVKGSAEAGSTVRIYATADCSGTPLASGAANELSSTGLTVNVADDRTTSLRATARDAAGNDSACSSALDYTEDSTPPDTTLTDFPPPKTTKRRVEVAFISTEPDPRFRCSLDQQPVKLCESPWTKRVSLGTHVFRVYALDQSGNLDPTPAKAKFRVID